MIPDIFAIFSQFSYIGPFVVLFVVNIMPILMPPNWLILSSFYALDNSMNIVVLTLIGATASTAGRFVLKQIVSIFKDHSNDKITNLSAIGNYLNRKKYGYIISSFIFGATPLPDNILFVTYGLIKARGFGIYLGFWLGKVTSLYVMLSISPAILTPFTKIFEDRLLGILFADALGIVIIIIFSIIDWNYLLNERKIKLIKPKIWRL